MMNTSKFLLTAAIAGLTLSSCSDNDDNPEAVNEEEVITTMVVTLSNVDDEDDTVLLTFRDPDGSDGPTEPTINVAGNLKASTSYAGNILLTNETEDPFEVINEEIEEEADEHQFFYIVDGLDINIAYEDEECDYDESCEADGTGRPVGLEFAMVTGDDTGEGSLNVVLRHQLNKDAEGVAEGNIANAGGDTDITVNFEIEVEEE